MERQRKLMLLGGLRYLLPVIEAGHKLGCHVITCDYLPDNIAHKYADEYCNISIIDKTAVLRAAEALHIDGIMSFGVDAGVTTAAFVAEKLGLPAPGPYKSVCTLQNKDKFRQFLADNGFNVPKARGYNDYAEIVRDMDRFSWPVIVKPVDSAGSKGVTRVDNETDLKAAVEIALRQSISKRVIVEEFIEKAGCSSDTDCFSVDGMLKFVSFNAQRFDEHAANEYTPAAYSWPSTMTAAQEQQLTQELQRLLTLLQMRTSVYNVETRVDKAGKPYIMEISPRGGGNRLAEVIRYATGVDLITNAVRAALGEKLVDMGQQAYKGHWAEVILHSRKSGRFQQLVIDDDIRRNHLVETDLWVQKGDIVTPFCGANAAIGTLILKFNSAELLNNKMNHIDDWLNVVVK